MADPARPNLLLVFADQLRAGMTSIEGDPHAITPHLDRFAASGVLVENAIANTPVCCPCRGSMWTGVWPTMHRVVSNDLAIRTDLPTLARTLRNAGYRTAYIGKWHLDGVPRRKFTPPGPRRLGFDDFWAAYNCAHDYFAPRYYLDDDQLHRPAGYEPTVQTDLAIEELDRAVRDSRPFATVLSWGPPHDPYDQVPASFRARFDPATIRLPENVIERTNNPLARGLDCRRVHADYRAAVAALDAEFGRLLDAIEDRGLSDNTLVVFTSDHGDMLWSHGLLKKQAPHEESIRVPLFLRGPMLPSACRLPTLIGLLDLMPTLLGMLGISSPIGLHGRDLSAPLRRGENRSVHDAVLIGNLHSCDEAAAQHLPAWRGIRTARYTYVERRRGEPWLLFDNQSDPLQLDNLLDRPNVRPLQETLGKRLYELLDACHDPFVSGDELLARLGLAEAWKHREECVNA